MEEKWKQTRLVTCSPPCLVKKKYRSRKWQRSSFAEHHHAPARCIPSEKAVRSPSFFPCLFHHVLKRIGVSPSNLQSSSCSVAAIPRSSFKISDTNAFLHSWALKGASVDCSALRGTGSASRTGDENRIFLPPKDELMMMKCRTNFLFLAQEMLAALQCFPTVPVCKDRSGRRTQAGRGIICFKNFRCETQNPP
jgi:hypothetical protein